jgi:hypothetical protein
MVGGMDSSLFSCDSCSDLEVADMRTILPAVERPDTTARYPLVTTPGQADLAGFSGSPRIHAGALTL